MATIYGVRHRVKKTAEGEPRPTQIAALSEDGLVGVRELSDGKKELEWVKTLQKGDTLAMSLGGSGDCLAFAAAHFGNEVGAQVLRIPPFVLKAEREALNGASNGKDKDEDAQILARLAHEKRDLFYPVLARERAHILMRERARARDDAKKARVACEQRIYARLIGSVYTSPDGLFPEGGIEKAFDAAKANDRVLAALVEEEQSRNRDLERSLVELDVYQRVFKPITGMGPLIAGPIIAGINDIRLFKTHGKLKAFCAVGCTPDGKFRRKRKGERFGGNIQVRAALYNFWDQMNRRPKSAWGEKFLRKKERLAGIHPDWTVGHVHKAARWHTLGDFVEHIYHEW